MQPVISNNILTRMQHLLTTRFFCVCCAYQCNTTLTPAASILYLVCPDRCAVSRCPTGAGKSAPVISGQSFPSLVLLRIFWACKVTEYHFFSYLTAVPSCFGTAAAGPADLILTFLMRRPSMGNLLKIDLITSFYFSFLCLAVLSLQNNFDHMEVE